MNTQINRANSARREVVRNLEGAVREFVFGKKGNTFELPTAIEADLTTVAPRPTSLGFSDHDLSHFANFYASLAEKKAADWQWQNRKLQRMQHPSKEAIAERDKRYNRVKVIRLILGVLQDELARREGVRLEEAREVEAQRAEIEARAAEQQAEVEALIESLPPVKMKAPKRKSKSTPKARKSFSKTITSEDASNPFEALKGEVTARTRADWSSRAIKKAEAVSMVGDEEALVNALRFAQKMGTDEVIDLENGVLRYRRHGNSVRYEYFGS